MKLTRIVSYGDGDGDGDYIVMVLVYLECGMEEQPCIDPYT